MCTDGVQLPWKSLPSIVEYYYMWKTTDRFVQQVRVNLLDPQLPRVARQYND